MSDYQLFIDEDELGPELVFDRNVASDDRTEKKNIGFYEGMYRTTVRVAKSAQVPRMSGKETSCLKIVSHGVERSGICHPIKHRLDKEKQYLISCKIFCPTLQTSLRMGVKGNRERQIWATDIETGLINFMNQPEEWASLVGTFAVEESGEFQVVILHWEQLPMRWYLKDISIREIIGVEPRQHKASPNFPLMRKQLYYQAFLELESLSSLHYALINKDDQLYIPLVLMKHQGLMKHLSAKYSLPISIVEYLLNVEISNLKINLNFAPETKRAVTFSEFAHNRFFEHKRHVDLIKKLSEEFHINHHAFFDIGCKYGTSMISALEQGYKVAHGCDFDKRVINDTKNIMKLAKPSLKGELSFYDSDFLKLNLQERYYDLILLINILEHTPNLELTIKHLSQILSKNGIAYVFQGNYKSLSMVLDEPHYHMPILTLLPKELTIEILLKLKLINSPEEYCVTQWPDCRYLRAISTKYGLSLEICQKVKKGYYSRDTFIHPEVVDKHKEYIITQTERRIYPLLNQDNRFIVKDILNAYFKEVYVTMEQDTIEKKLMYLKRNWDIIFKVK